jgi:hypothetical protein
VTVFGYSAGAVQRRPELLATAVLVAGGTLLLVGLLTAIYLGAVDDALVGRRSDHIDNLRRHAPVTLAFAAMQFLGLFVLLGVGMLGTGAGSIRGSASLLLLAIIAGMAGLYLLTPGVYAGVTADLGPRTAFERGVDIALTYDYLTFALSHALAVAVVSVPLSALGFAGGLWSLVFVAVIAAPVALALNAATMAFVHDRLGVASTGGGTDDPTPAVRRMADGDG